MCLDKDLPVMWLLNDVGTRSDLKGLGNRTGGPSAPTLIVTGYLADLFRTGGRGGGTEKWRGGGQGEPCLCIADRASNSLIRLARLDPDPPPSP